MPVPPAVINAAEVVVKSTEKLTVIKIPRNAMPKAFIESLRHQLLRRIGYVSISTEKNSQRIYVTKYTEAL